MQATSCKAQGAPYQHRAFAGVAEFDFLFVQSAGSLKVNAVTFQLQLKLHVLVGSCGFRIVFNVIVYLLHIVEFAKPWFAQSPRMFIHRLAD